MLVNVRVILLVGVRQDYVHVLNEKLDSHITENRRAFRRFGSIFLKIFGGNRCRLM
jgi:hypothetical protein